MSLADHMGDQYLRSGDHVVKVTAYTSKEVNDKTLLSLAVNDHRGHQSKVEFWLTEKAIFRLARFAKACGLTDEQMAAYKEYTPDSARVLMGKKVGVRVEPQERDSKYHEVTDWWPFEGEAPAAPPLDLPVRDLTPVPNEGSEETPKTDCPF